MAERIEIELLVHPDGTVEMITHGLKGQSCLTETEALEKALGKTVEREKTREYYESVASKAKIKTGR